ncbi:hypothetical protein CEUSTIGMA_g13766.t1 [Chlamydomonas eustigma]|uniref:Uncharacterized protein n=1 Tax=Chlamydomonas eustigma TaxID=1157962 RepID=A0A250XTF4_9CHLO|nr:hypothetical protein CEUSTIGMA_g13766.t1 [Chlamydomonas eustigma]|eukprot:GAX86354.1 hypothetical protein CEUSTIGMA_g13766.t1 [Chlamydomonas eustigma]
MMPNKPSTLALHSAATSSAASHRPCHSYKGFNMDAANASSRIAGCQRQAQHTNTSSSKKKEEAKTFIILELKGERELTGATSGLTANRLKERSRKEHIADATYRRAREELMVSGHIKFYRGTNTATGGV